MWDFFFFFKGYHTFHVDFNCKFRSFFCVFLLSWMYQNALRVGETGHSEPLLVSRWHKISLYVDL